MTGEEGEAIGVYGVVEGNSNSTDEGVELQAEHSGMARGKFRSDTHSAEDHLLGKEQGLSQVRLAGSVGAINHCGLWSLGSEGLNPAAIWSL